MSDVPAKVWAVFRDADDTLVAGPFESQGDAQEYVGGFDDVYAAKIEEELT
ncbi:MAG TPA: hypothetical protein VIQ30_24380 [Pseudonocardia sp.]